MKKSMSSILSLIILLTIVLISIQAFAAMSFEEDKLTNTAGEPLYGLHSYGTGNSKADDLYWFDETTGIARKNATITFSHVVFETGEDGKIAKNKIVENPFTGELMTTYGIPETGYEDDPRVILFLWGLSKNGAEYKLKGTDKTKFSCGEFTQAAFTAINYISARSSSHFQAVSCRQPDTMTSGGYPIGYLTNVPGTGYNRPLVYPKLIYSSDPSEGTANLSEVQLRVGDHIFYEVPSLPKNNFNEGGTSTKPGPYYAYMHLPENEQLLKDVEDIHHASIYVGQGKIMESGANNDYYGVHVTSLRETDGMKVKWIYRYIDDDATDFDDKAVENVSAVKDNENVVVSWDPITGAEGYLIYGASDNSDITLKGTVSGGTISSYVDEHPSDIYYVRAYTTILASREKKLSPFSNSAATISKIAIHKVESGNKQAFVYFSIRSANGKGYFVYLSQTGLNGVFERYDNVNYNSKGVHIRGLENGETYYVRIVYLEQGVITSQSDSVEVKAR